MRIFIKYSKYGNQYDIQLNPLKAQYTVVGGSPVFTGAAGQRLRFRGNPSEMRYLAHQLLACAELLEARNKELMDRMQQDKEAGHGYAQKAQ